MIEPIRCKWCVKTAIEREYHDTEWGVPLHDDRKWFEFLILDGAQAGLSWSTILNKREGYRDAFHQFDPEMVARMTETDVERLMQNPAIIRNRLKIKGAITNAQQFLEVQNELGSFDSYIWQFTDGQVIHNAHETMHTIPATSPQSDTMSKALKKRGFKFVGSTICYAMMQAAGMVNDHTTDCFRYAEIRSLSS